MEDDLYEFHYMGVETNYTSFKNIVLLYKEVFKLAKNLCLSMDMEPGKGFQ